MTVDHFLHYKDLICFSISAWRHVTKRFWIVIERPDTFTIAGIHTALLAILVAGLSVYVIFVFSKIQDLEMRALQEAEHINSIGYIRSSYGLLTQEELFDREKLVKMLDSIMLGSEDRSLPKGREERTAKSLAIMSVITHQYPFPELIFKTKDGRMAMGGEPESIYFGNIEDVRQWVKAMDEITRPLKWWHILKGNFSIMLSEFSKSDEVIKIKELHKGFGLRDTLIKDDGTPFFSSEEDEPTAIYSGFINKLTSAKQIMKSTGYYLKQMDVLRAKYPSKATIFIGFLIVGVSFVFGVIVPISCQSVRNGIVLMPFLFYGLIYMYLLFQMFRYVR